MERFVSVNRGVLALAVGSMLFSAGCTTLRFTAKNDTEYSLKYEVKVRGDVEWEETLAPGDEKTAELVGKFRSGSDVDASASFETGGRVQRVARSLPRKPGTFNLKLKTTVVAGEVVDFTKPFDWGRANLNKAYRSPADGVHSLLNAALNGIYKCPVPLPALDPGCNPAFSPEDLEAVQTRDDLLATGRFVYLRSANTVVDRQAAGRLKVDVPAMADVSANFGAAELYRFKFKMTNTGWVQSPTSWHGIQTRLERTQKGRRMLQRIRAEFRDLKPNERLFLLDRAYIIGKIELEKYQGRRLAADVDVDVASIVTVGGAFSISSESTNEEVTQNAVLRVDYRELDPPRGNVIPAAEEGAAEQAIMAEEAIPH